MNVNISKKKFQILSLKSNLNEKRVILFYLSNVKAKLQKHFFIKIHAKEI